jgi:RHS repeat-associated protein
MVTSLLQAFGGTGSSDASHAARHAGNLSPFRNFNSNDYQRLKDKAPDENRDDKPKAYLNFALFDDQFNLVEDNSGVRQVKGEPDQLQNLAVDKMVVTKSGFLYVYTSNETQQDVFFDNVTVATFSGPILEETHYYPFGLTMAGISSNALMGTNYPENRKKYNGIEFTTDLDLDIYDAQFRNLDPQIGRWNQIDPKTENMEMWSPYVSNYNNPILYNDFLGDEPYDGGPGFWESVKYAVVEMGQQVLSATAGAADAYISNNLAGAGRIDVSSTGLTGKNAIAYQVGQKVGDAAAVVTGAMEDVTAGAGELLSLGTGTPIAVPVAIHGTVTAGIALKNLLTPIKYMGGNKKGRRDLVAEAKEAQAKEAAAKKRAAKREQASAQGRNKTGNSNQEVRGDHNTNTSGGNRNKHEEANARRAREQKAADKKKKKS